MKWRSFWTASTSPSPTDSAPSDAAASPEAIQLAVLRGRETSEEGIASDSEEPRDVASDTNIDAESGHRHPGNGDANDDEPTPVESEDVVGEADSDGETPTVAGQQSWRRRSTEPTSQPNHFELMFYSHVEHAGGRSLMQLFLFPEGVFFAQVFLLGILTLINSFILVFSNNETANWLFVYTVLVVMGFDVYLQGVLVSIRLFNYRPRARKLVELRALKRSALFLLCVSAGAFSIKGRGDAELSVLIIFVIDFALFVLFYGWFSEFLQFFCPCVWCFGDNSARRNLLTFQTPAKPELISQTEIDGMPTEVFAEARFVEEGRSVPDECSICIDPFVDGEEVNALPCGHCFHTVCMREWLERMDNPTCPTCRQDVRGGGPKPGHVTESDL